VTRPAITRRLLLGPLLFVALGWLLGAALDHAARDLAPPYPAESARFEMMEQRAERIRVLSAGNSHCLSIDFDALGMADRGFHVWLAGEDLFELESQMSALLPRLPKLETVLLSVSFASFHRDNGADTSAERSGVRRKFYAIPPGYPMIPGDWENWLKGRMAGLVREDHFLGVLSGLELALRRPGFEPAPPPELGPTGAIDLRRKITEGNFDEMTVSARTTVKRHWDLQQDMMAHNPSLPDSAYQSLRRTLTMMQDRGLRVICFTAPVFDAYARNYDRQTIREMHAYLDRLVEEFDVEYHDFSDDRQFSGVAEFFANPDHLNETGAAAFSRHRLAALLTPP
jgi:hypothetical protein